MVIKSKYIDLNSINHPIKEYIDTLSTVKIHPKVSSRDVIYIERNMVVLDDSIFGPFVEPEKVEFNKVCERERIVEERFNNIDGQNRNLKTTHSYTFLIGPDTYQYERKIFTFLELTSILGGLFELFEVGLSLLFGVLYSYFSKRSLLKIIKTNMKQLEKTTNELENLKKNFDQKENGKDEKSPIPVHQNEEIKVKMEDERPKENASQLFGNVRDALSKYREERKVGIDIKAQSLPVKTTQNYSNPVEVYGHHSNKLLYKFFEKRDCVDILFRIEYLEQKMKYLLHKDPDYQLTNLQNSESKNISPEKPSSEVLEESLSKNPLFPHKSMPQIMPKPSSQIELNPKPPLIHKSSNRNLILNSNKKNRIEKYEIDKDEEDDDLL